MSRAAASAAAKAASTQANREREWAARVADERAELARERAELARLQLEAERLQTVAVSAETAATSAKERFELEARRLESDRAAVRDAREALERELLRASQSRAIVGVGANESGGPNQRVGRSSNYESASKSRGSVAVLSRGFVEKEAAMDERRKREREELEALRAEADAKLRLARETLESARKERESARKELGVGRGVGVLFPGASSRDLMPPPPPRSAMPTPRQLRLDSEPSTPRDFSDAAGSAPEGDADPNQNPDPDPNPDPNDTTPGDAAIEALVDNLARRTAEAEKKLTRAENLAAGSQIGGSKVNVASGIAALRSRLARIAVNSRRLTHASTATSDVDGPSKKETIAQLEQQERELASWFAELQSQLEALFARPKTARRSAVRSSWN